MSTPYGWWFCNNFPVGNEFNGQRSHLSRGVSVEVDDILHDPPISCEGVSYNTSRNFIPHDSAGRSYKLLGKVPKDGSVDLSICPLWKCVFQLNGFHRSLPEEICYCKNIFFTRQNEPNIGGDQPRRFLLAYPQCMRNPPLAMFQTCMVYSIHFWVLPYKGSVTCMSRGTTQ